MTALEAARPRGFGAAMAVRRQLLQHDVALDHGEPTRRPVVVDRGESAACARCAVTGSRSSRAPVPSFRFDPLSCRPPVLSTGRATGSPVVEVLWKWVRGMRAGETRVTRRTPVCGVTWAEIG